MIVWDPISKSEGKGVVLPLTISALLAEAKENTIPSYATAVPPGKTLASDCEASGSCGDHLRPDFQNENEWRRQRRGSAIDDALGVLFPEARESTVPA